MARLWTDEELARLPWPVRARYPSLRRHLDPDNPGSEVSAVWLVRDSWEALLKFVASAAVCDALSTEGQDARKIELVFELIGQHRQGGHTIHNWMWMLLKALHRSQTGAEGPFEGARLAGLAPLLFDSNVGLLKVPGDKVQWNNPGACFSGSVFDKYRNFRNGLAHGVFNEKRGYYHEMAGEWLEQLNAAYKHLLPELEKLQVKTTRPNSAGIEIVPASDLPAHYRNYIPRPDEDFHPLYLFIDGIGRTEVLDLQPLMSVQRRQRSDCGEWACFFFEANESSSKVKSRFLDFISGHINKALKIPILVSWTEEYSDKFPEAPQLVSVPDIAEPDIELFPRLKTDFESPAYLAKRIAAFIKERGTRPGIVSITGSAGLGKSWATRGLGAEKMLPTFLNQKVTLVHLSLHNRASLDAMAFVDLLISLGEKEELETDRTSLGTLAPRKRIESVLRQWFTGVTRLRGLLFVVVDGLDELSSESDIPDALPYLQDLPDRCFLVFTLRPDSLSSRLSDYIDELQRGRDGLLEIAMSPDSPEHRNVLVNFLKMQFAKPDEHDQTLPVDWIPPIIDQARGSFLFVNHYWRALSKGRFPDPSGLPQPEDYYPDFFEYLRSRCLQSIGGNLAVFDNGTATLDPEDDLFESYYVPVIALLAVAQEPITLPHLQEWTGRKPENISFVVGHLSEFLTAHREQDETRYEIGHTLTRDYLINERSWNKRIVAAHERIVVHTAHMFREESESWKYGNLQDSTACYAFVHLAAHLDSETSRSCLLPQLFTFVEGSLGFGQRFQEGLRPYRAVSVYTNTLECMRLAESSAPRVKDESFLENLASKRASLHFVRAYAHSCQSDLLGAEADYNAAIRIWAALCAELKREGRCPHEYRHHLAQTHMNRGNVRQMQLRAQEAEHDFTTAIEFITALWEEFEPDCCPHSYRHDLAMVHVNRGEVRRTLERLQEAEADCSIAIGLMTAMRNQLMTEGYWPDKYQHSLASAHLNRGNNRQKLERAQEAAVDYTTAIELMTAMRELLKAQDMWTHEHRNTLAKALVQRGSVWQSLERAHDAEDDYNAGIKIMAAQREELEQHSRWPNQYKYDLATAYIARGTGRKSLQRAQEADNDYSTAIKLMTALRTELGIQGRWPQTYENTLANAYMNRGTVRQTLLRGQEADDDCTTAIELMTALRKDLEPKECWSHAYRNDLAGALTSRGTVRQVLQFVRQAKEDYTAAIELRMALRDELEAAGRWTPEYRNGLATAHFNFGILLGVEKAPSESAKHHAQAAGIWTELVKSELSQSEFVPIESATHGALAHGLAAEQLMLLLSEVAASKRFDEWKRLYDPVFEQVLEHFRKACILAGTVLATTEVPDLREQLIEWSGLAARLSREYNQTQLAVQFDDYWFQFHGL